MAGLAGGWRVDFPRHDAEQLFALAADIESYPRFLPWCRSARILSRRDQAWEVDNVFGAGPVLAHFRSHAVFDRPHLLEITASEAPFRRFRLSWRFEPLGAAGCRVTAYYAMDLRSSLLAAMARMALPEMERKVVQRFKDRVRQVYGR